MPRMMLETRKISWSHSLDPLRSRHSLSQGCTQLDLSASACEFKVIEVRLSSGNRFEVMVFVIQKEGDFIEELQHID